MKPPKPTWKSRALAAEKELENKIVHFQGKLVDEEVKKQLAARPSIVKLQSLLAEKQHELDYRPTVEVEKEVLPPLVNLVFMCVTLVLLAIIVGQFVWVQKLQQPILQYKLVEGHTVYRPDPVVNSKLVACQDSWREDEAELKVLRRKLKDRQEGTTFVE